jgi:type IV pilus assembly protein PilE
MQAHPRKTGAGFTLLELMIVVVIIAILAAIAIPNYLKYSLRSRRSDAIAALIQNQGILERCYAATFNYNSYATVTPVPAGCAAPQTTSPNGFYTIQPAVSATTYTITAVPRVGSPQVKDTACLSMSINNKNLETPTPNGGITNCWAQ